MLLRSGSIVSMGAMAIAIQTPALAQANDENTEIGVAEEASNDSEVLSSIIVTGSRIRGVQPTGSVLIDVGRDAIAESPATSAAQIIQDLPSVFNLGASESARVSAGGLGNQTYAQGINIHGIGAYATLVLIDGIRTTPQGIAATINDTSHVPPIALERIDIVPDGASALYGSDAIAGVANLVIRRNFEGFEASATVGFADDYKEYSAGFIVGTDWGSGHGMIAYNYSGHTDLNSADRSYVGADLTASGGRDYSVSSCNPGTLSVNGNSYAIPEGGVTAANVGELQAGTNNRCDPYANADLFPEISRHNVIATFDQDIVDGVSIFGTGFVSIRDIFLDGPLNFTTLSLPETNAFYVSPEDGAQTVSYAFDQLPGDDIHGTASLYQGTLGLRAELFGDWLGEIAYTRGYSNDISRRYNLINTAGLTAALADDNPASAFNPYGAANTSLALDRVGQGRRGVQGKTNHMVVDVGADGSLFSLPGGDVRLAVGYQHVETELNTHLLLGSVGAPFSIQTIFFNRIANSGYAEAQIPIFGEDNGFAGMRRLDINAAVRYDHYNDFGSTTNPKFGVSWEPIYGLTFRGSYGTSFRAPAIVNAHGVPVSVVTNLPDPLAGGALVTGLAASGGNPDAGPEKATTWSLGMDFKTGDTVRFQGSVNYFNVEYSDIVVSLGANTQVLNQADIFEGTNVIQRNPTPEQVAAFLAAVPFSGGGVIPDPVPFIIRGASVNLGVETFQGIDFNANLSVPMNSGEIVAGVSGLYFLEHKNALTPNAPYVDLRNRILFPINFQARGNLGWRTDVYNVTATLNFTGSYKNNLVTPIEKVDSFVTIDTHFDVDLGEAIGGGITDGLRLALDIENLFDRDPPFVNIGPSSNNPGGFDATLHSSIGRKILFGVKKSF